MMDNLMDQNQIDGWSKVRKDEQMKGREWIEGWKDRGKNEWKGTDEMMYG